MVGIFQLHRKYSRRCFVINTTIKGNRIQLKIIKQYKADGWQIGKVVNKDMNRDNTDLWGLFDLCAIRKGEVHFIQVTCNRPHTHYKYQDFANEHASKMVQIWQYVWMDRKGFKEFLYKESGVKYVWEKYKRW